MCLLLFNEPFSSLRFLLQTSLNKHYQGRTPPGPCSPSWVPRSKRAALWPPMQPWDVSLFLKSFSFAGHLGDSAVGEYLEPNEISPHPPPPITICILPFFTPGVVLRIWLFTPRVIFLPYLSNVKDCVTIESCSTPSFGSHFPWSLCVFIP